MGDVGRILDVYMLIFFLFSLTKVLFLIMKNKMTKLIGIDFKSLGPDVYSRDYPVCLSC